MSNILQTRSRFSVLFIALLFFFACGDEPQTTSVQPGGGAPTKVKKIKKKVVAVKKKEVDVKKEEKFVYTYDPSGKIDPFFPILVEKKIEKEEMAATETGEPKTYLETLDLSQLKLVAVMIMGARSVAMVEDPEGKGHTIYKGTPIGKSGGVVVGIVEGKVMIEEKYKKKGAIVPVIKELVIQSAEDKK